MAALYTTYICLICRMRFIPQHANQLCCDAPCTKQRLKKQRQARKEQGKERTM